VDDPARTVAANGSLMNVFGSNLVKVGANLDGFGALDVLPQTVNGTSMTVGGVKAPFALLDPGQLIFQVPVDVPAGVQPVIVTNSNGPSAAFNLTVAPASPNIFFDSVGGFVFRTNFSLIRPRTQPRQTISGHVRHRPWQTSSPLNTGRIVPGGPRSSPRRRRPSRSPVSRSRRFTRRRAGLRGTQPSCVPGADGYCRR